eukprot:TRINITY_DN31152_c0_g1_i1.p1 TRINITY_DN31152_c0_g1~~TRINITY_DN31152_c0_g1_i1.p1  ORF type:complete len:324 (-),score=26.28 TRINITY_DN31152_c0_g1_i1:28-855(-)
MAKQAAVYIEHAGIGICSPLFDKEGCLQYLSQATADLLSLNNAKVPVSVANVGGVPAGAAYARDGTLFTADLLQCSVQSHQHNAQQRIAASYDDRPLRGPSAVAVDTAGTVYFTDSGPVGETGLHSPTGSVFCLRKGGPEPTLRPLALECLASPSGIAVSPNGSCVYVTERAANRLLRFVQNPPGVFHYSVFRQFSGGFGPSCVACDAEGTIYVGMFDFAEQGGRGSVAVIARDGSLQAEIPTPGPEVTGVAVSPDGRHLYITEASTQTVYRVAL